MARSEDRISKLPNEILQSILCLMPLKCAIRTSTLSKRWIHLWQFNLISSTSLQFHQDFSCHQSPKQFATILDRYLHLHGNRKLHKFSILFSPFECFFPNLEKWVGTVLGKGVRELEMDLSQGVLNSFRKTYMDDRMPFPISDSLFNSSSNNNNSLTHLSLSRCNFSLSFNLNTSFVGLSSLSLHHVNITDEMLTNIMQICVSLTNIGLKRCEYLEVVKFVGDKLKLQKLVLVDNRGVYDIEISAPELESFVYHGWISFSHYFGNVSKLSDAYFCSVGLEDNDEEAFEVLLHISHVKVLTICSYTLIHVVLEEEFNQADFPLELRNLQELQLILDLISDEHLYCVLSFFRLCPSPVLEKLFIQLTSDPYHDLSDSVTAEKDTPDVVFENLRWIKITNFEGSPLEIKLVKFLLEKATVLESIIIIMNQCDKSNNNCLHRRIVEGQVSILPKTSVDVRIVIICGPSDSDDDCTMNPTHNTYYHQEKYQNGTTVHLDHATIGSDDIPLDQDFL